MLRMSVKVCMLSSAHDADDTRIFYKEAKSLAEAGYDVVYIVPHDRETAEDGVRIVPLEKPKGRLRRMSLTVWRLWRRAVRENADVYHFHDPELIPVGLLLKRSGKRVVYDVHEDVPRQILSKHWIPSAFRGLVSRWFERFEAAAARRFDGIAAATPFIADRFRPLNARTYPICNYPILAEFNAALPAAGAHAANKERAVCYVGGIAKVRGIREMVEALQYTDVKLLLAGTFMSAVERESLSQRPGWERVEELGHLGREQVRRTMERAVAGLVVLHPLVNYVDALPIKMFEYMAAGIPVICSRFPLWRDIVEGAGCGICVSPLDPLEIAGAIQWFADHPEEAADMGKRGRAAVETQYNWHAQSVELLKLYGGLAVIPMSARIPVTNTNQGVKELS